MEISAHFIKRTISLTVLKFFRNKLFEFLETIGYMVIRLAHALMYIVRGRISFAHLIEQSSRFAVDSLPITLTIVSMTSVILAVQIAPEMVKQGGGNYIGMLLALVTVREIGAIMTGFAIISMIGSSMAAEIATMKVTDQISAMKVLKVDPLQYLFVPRILAGMLMMPLVTVISSTVGILAGGLVTSLTCPEISGLNFVTSVKIGLYNRDIGIMCLKASCFGAAIALISSSCGYDANGGAKSVGEATTKAVVWSFIAIVIIDSVFALLFYF